MKTNNKKGQGLSGIPSAALYIGIAVFTVALLISVLATFQDTFITGATNCTSSTDGDACAAGFNATGAGITGLSTFNDFWAVLVLIVILAVVITALYAVFPRRAGY